MAEPAETTETRLIYAEGRTFGGIYIKIPVAVETVETVENEPGEPETDDHQD